MSGGNVARSHAPSAALIQHLPPKPSRHDLRQYNHHHDCNKYGRHLPPSEHIDGPLQDKPDTVTGQVFGEIKDEAT